jgi:calcineurin-like phosphoesterase family protein
LSEIWFIGDTHFGHKNILGFYGGDGALIRPNFGSVKEMDDFMVERWNAVVKPEDKVYHLGDVCVGTKGLGIVRLLNGRKRLIRGNHDKFRTKYYLDVGFKEVYGCRRLEQLWLTHIPMHPASIGKALGNVHGHIHQNPSPEGRYLNVSVEAIAYTPLVYEDVVQQLKEKHA